MKVITGISKGCNLISISGDDITRPTSSRVKESIFSSIQFDIEGKNVLDLFAGTGQMGIEALSRGAKNCIFVDNHFKNISVIETNLKKTNLKNNATIILSDFSTFLKGSDKIFDIVFLDPPYNSGFYNICLNLLKDMLSSGAIIVCESKSKEKIIVDDKYYKIYKEKIYSNTKITIFNRV